MKHVVCLYDMSGLAARDWANAGYDVYCYDVQNKDTKESVGKGTIHYMSWDARDSAQNKALVQRHTGRVVLLLAFPPCTDLAVSGARHFAAKSRANPAYREEAMALVYTARDIAETLTVPYVIENPVSVISSEWRKPNYIFHPWEYGGYLPEGDAHPLWPRYIAPRDAYPKTTCYWTGGGFRMPTKKSVAPAPGYSKQHKLLGGRSQKTKTIRSLSPRGIARAIFEMYNRGEE